jgi:hypothetical protein
MDASVARNRIPTSLFDTLKQMKYSFKVLKWAPKSSHLSLFEKIWSNIEGTIRLQRRKPTTAAQLWDLVEMVWERRSEQPLFWPGLIHHLTAKLRSIAAANGEQTETEMKD